MFWKKKQISIGEIGENEAVKYLKKKGYQIINRNYQNQRGKRVGEIDVIAQKGEKLFFVEVKTRVLKNSKVVLPEENITREKLFKLQRIAQNYIRENDFWDKEYQFDAISVILGDEDNAVLDLKHLESIFY